MSKAKYIAFDCETGGLVDGVSLLTVYFAALDENFEILGECYLRQKPDDGVYHCTAEALGVNGINLIEHDKIAKSKSDNGAELRLFLMTHSDYGKNKLIPLGHNVAQDAIWVWENILNKKAWEVFCSYRKLDTGAAAILLIAAGLMPEMNAGLGNLVEYFKIEKLPAHDCKNDTIMTKDVAREMVKLLKQLKEMYDTQCASKA